jgi:Carboxypeptidase regulatory-like domain
MRKRAYLMLLLIPLLCRAQGRVASPAGGYRISGTVVNELTGKSISGARVLLAPTSGAQWAKTTLAGKDGRFSFTGLKAEKYQLYAERAGYPRQGFDQHDGGYFTGIVTGPGQVSDHLLFKLQPASVIQGVISDEFNEPVRGAQVMVFRRGIRQGVFGTYVEGQDQTDDRGFYRFGSLLAGKYFIVIVAHPWYARNQSTAFQSGVSGSNEEGEDVQAFNVAFPITFYPGTTEEADATEINLRTGQQVDTNMALHSVRAVRLRLIEAQGDQRNVRLSQKIFGEFEVPAQGMMMGSPEQGRMLGGIAPGRYEVIVENVQRDGSTHVRTFFRRGFGSRRASSSRTIDLSGDTSLDLNSLATDQAASINGLARAEGVTLRNAFVQLRNQETREVQGSPIETDGTFTIPELPPGTYEVSIANSASVYLANMAASGAKASGRTLEVPNGGAVQLAMLLSKGIGQVKGTAMRGDKGFAGAMIVLVPDKPAAHPSLFRRDQSDSDGTFTLRDVVPGKYTLLAIKDGWEMEWSNPAALKPFLPGGTPLEVQPNGKYDAKVSVQLRTP